MTFEGTTSISLMPQDCYLSRTAVDPQATVTLERSLLRLFSMENHWLISITGVNAWPGVMVGRLGAEPRTQGSLDRGGDCSWIVAVTWCFRNCKHRLWVVVCDSWASAPPGPRALIPQPTFD